MDHKCKDPCTQLKWSFQDHDSDAQQYYLERIHAVMESSFEGK